MAEKTKCEFCGTTDRITESTLFNGFYCIKCYRLNLAAIKDAMQNILDEERRQTLEG